MSGTEHPDIRLLRHAFEQAEDPAVAQQQQAYMKNQFVFFGIKTDQRRSISKAWLREQTSLGPSALARLVQQLWDLPQREFQYTAQECIEHHRKNWDESTITLIEHCITHKSWWDTVDYVSATLAGAWFKKHPAEKASITGRWNRSDNMWLNRASLLFQLKYKKQTDLALLEKYIKHLSGSKEFFIQKAIGWILREYSKTDPAWVRKFIEKNKLPALSVREGSKYI